MNPIQTILSFIFGLILGSFFNVLIYRLPREDSIVSPGSHCPGCKRPIKPVENIPLVSFIFLGGRCAGCKARISIQYPLVEIITGCLSVIIWNTAIQTFLAEPHQWWEFISLTVRCASILILIPISVIDLSHYIIPDVITFPGLIIGLGTSFLPGGITPLDSLMGMAAGGGSLLLVGAIGEYILRKKDSMGGGDVKLMAFLGSIWGWKTALLSIMFASVLGSVAGILLILIRVLGRERRIPFGPFLALGLLTAVMFGETIISSYIEFVERMLGL